MSHHLQRRPIHVQALGPWPIVCTLLWCARVYATVFVYEGFSEQDYTAGPIDGQNGGLGHYPWRGYGAYCSGTHTDASVVLGPNSGLTHPNVAGNGGHAYGCAVLSPRFSIQQMSTNKEPLYYGFLMYHAPHYGLAIGYPFIFERHYLPGGIPPFPEFPYHSMDHGVYFDETNSLGFGSNTLLEGFWVGSSEWIFPYTQKVHQVVIKFAFTNNGTYIVSTYIDPSPDDESSPFHLTSGVDELLRTQYSYLDIHFAMRGGGTISDCYWLHFDEVRVANTWAEMFWYRLQYSATPGGTIVGPTSQLVCAWGTGDVVTAVASNYFTFQGWSDGVTNATRRDGGVLSSTNVTAIFAPVLAPLGTPYWWLAEHDLVQHSGSFEAAELQDTDEDGLINWEEFVVNTDPTNPASVFRQVQAGVSNGLLTIAVEPSATDRLYTLQVRTNLLHGSWMDFTSSAGSGGTFQFVLPAPEAPCMYLRTKVTLPE